VEEELVAVEQERQSFRLWGNGEDGGWCFAHCRISVRPAAASGTDLKGDWQGRWPGFLSFPGATAHSLAPSHRDAERAYLLRNWRLSGTLREGSPPRAATRTHDR
jgi:hypothetical protein